MGRTQQNLPSCRARFPPRNASQQVGTRFMDFHLPTRDYTPEPPKCAFHPYKKQRLTKATGTPPPPAGQKPTRHWNKPYRTHRQQRTSMPLKVYYANLVGQKLGKRSVRDDPSHGINVLEATYLQYIQNRTATTQTTRQWEERYRC